MEKHKEKPNKPSAKTAVLTAVDSLSRITLNLVAKESVFPKRMRWMFSYKIADTMNDVHTCANTANGIKVKSHDEFVERHKFQTLAIAHMNALNVKMGLAEGVLDINTNEFDKWAGQFNYTLRCLQGWMNKDEKRYSEQFGELASSEADDDKDGRITKEIEGLLKKALFKILSDKQ